MNVYHLHVITPVLILWVVLCAPVMMDMYWIMMGCHVMVSNIIPVLILYLYQW